MHIPYGYYMENNEFIIFWYFRSNSIAAGYGNSGGLMESYSDVGIGLPLYRPRQVCSRPDIGRGHTCLLSGEKEVRK